MGNVSSINVQPAKGTSEQHNKREQKLDYVNKDKTHLNFSWEKDSIANVLANVKLVVKEKTGRSMQKKATPIREGVFNFKENHTDEEIVNAIRSIEKEFGIKPFQIHLHRDEGHTDVDGKWKPNLHGHVVFNWTNMETGKSFKLDKVKMSELQTFLASALNMERGISSDKKRLDAINYKVAVQSERYQNLKIDSKEEEQRNTELIIENESLSLDTENMKHRLVSLEMSFEQEERRAKELKKQIEEQKMILAKKEEQLKAKKNNLKNLMSNISYFDTKNLPTRLANELKAINASRSKHPDFDQQIKRAGYTLSQKNKPDENNNQTRGRKM